MPSPPKFHDRALSSKPFPIFSSSSAVRARIEAQASAPPADPSTPRPPPYCDTHPQPPPPFYTRPSPSSASAATPNPAPSFSTSTPPQVSTLPNLSNPVAIINGHLGTSTTYPEAWPLSWLALTKYPRPSPQDQTPRSQPYINGNTNARLAVHLVHAPPDDSSEDSSDAVAHPQPSFKPQAQQARSEEEKPEQGLREEGEQPKHSLEKRRFLRLERHRGDLYTETGLQGTRKGDFDSGYMEDPSSSGFRSLRSISPGIERREGPDIPSSITPVSSIIPNKSPPPPPPSPLPLHRVLYTFTLSKHDELPVRAGELVALLREFDDGWCMVEDILKQGGMLPRQCISDHPVLDLEDDDGISVTTTALSSMIVPHTVISERSETDHQEPLGRDVDEDNIQAIAAALPSLSIDDEPKDHIIDFLAQLARRRKAAPAQVVADMAAANEAIEARARRADEVDEEKEMQAKQNEELEGERDSRDQRERLNGLHAMLSSEASKSIFSQIADHLASQEEQKQLRREAEDEMRRETETERVIREAEDERLPSVTPAGGASGQQQKKKKNKNKPKQRKRGAW